MLQINSLTFTHRKDLRVILKDFNLVLNPGDKAVIIGEEGNGKSTLLKWIYDESLIEDYILSEGRKSVGTERLAYLAQELPAGERSTAGSMKRCRTVFLLFPDRTRVPRRISRIRCIR